MTLSIHFLVTFLSFLGGGDLLDEEWCRGGLLSGLRTCAPSADELREIPIWIKRLGDEDFEARERASQKLLRLGRAALPYLRDGLEAADPEVRRRCAECLWEMDNRESQIVLKLRCALCAKVAYHQQIQALREREKSCSKQTVLIREAEGFAQQCERDAERAERILRRLGVSRAELEMIKRKIE